MNIFKKKELSEDTKKLKSCIVNVTKGFSFLTFTFFIAFLLNEPNLVLHKTEYFLYSFANFTIILYLLTMLLTVFSYEMYSSIKSFFSKTSKSERENILNIIKSTNSNMSKTEQLCLEHIINSDKKVSYWSVIKKMKKIKA